MTTDAFTIAARAEAASWLGSDPDNHDCTDDVNGDGMLCTDEHLGYFCTGCAHYTETDMTEFPWPCRTIRALDGER